MSRIHWHVASGLEGYGPDASDADGFAAFDSLPEALDYARQEVEIWIDHAHGTAHGLAGSGDYRAAWDEVVRMERLETLVANLNPERKNAPAYVDDADAYRALQESQAADFPHQVAASQRLYLWQCEETDCLDADDEIPSETVSVSLVAMPLPHVPAVVDVERIAEDVLGAMYRAAHDGLQAAEGFARYGDVMPGELEDVVRFSRLLVRSVLANGRVNTRDASRTFPYVVTHDGTGEVLQRSRASSPLEALSNYSDAQGFARPDQMTREDCENLGGTTLRDALGYVAEDDGRSASITFTNYSITATVAVTGGDDSDA